MERLGGHGTRWLVVVLVVILVLSGLVGGALRLHSTATSVEAAPATIIGWEPGITRGLPVAAPLTVHFSRPMDRPTVEHAWRIRPSVQGVFHWSDTSVAFQPVRPLRSNARYRLTVGKAALDDGRHPLQNPLAVTFTTGNALAVQDVAPANGVADVPLNGLVAVTFNHPMVALAGLDAPVVDPAGWRISITPATAGSGNWLGTSTWVFHPTTGLAPSARYTITLSKSVRDVWRDPLLRTERWTFRTVTPAVTGVSPARGSSDANPNGHIDITFNQPMDFDSIRSAFTLRGNGLGISGHAALVGNTFQFTPARPLDPRIEYVATVGIGPRAAHASAVLAAPVSWSFHVASPPHVLSSLPAPGSTAANPYVELHFSAPMEGASLDHRLSVSPALPNMNTYASQGVGSGANVYSISGSFQPSTAYTVTIAAGARDIYGRVSNAPYTLHFVTAPLAPAAVFYGPAGAGTGITFSAGRIAQAPVQFVNVPSAHYTLVRTTPTAAMRNGFFASAGGPAGTVVREWSTSIAHPLNAVENTVVPLANADGSPLPAGVYWLGVQSPGISTPSPSSAELVVAANSSVTLKSSAHQALVWVTSATSGLPLAGVTVRLVDGRGAILATHRTDSRGVYLFSVANGQNIQAAIVDDGVHFGLATSSWQLVAPTDYSPVDAAGQFQPPPDGSYVYTDRPIYRPGQRVHFRAVLWVDHDGVYTLDHHSSAHAVVMDNRGKTLYDTILTPDRFGSVHGDFRLPASTPTGPANLTVSPTNAPPDNQPAASASFSVAEYRKPEFLTTVTAGKPSYVQGQTLIATVQVRYVFGVPVAGQQVAWTAYSRAVPAQPPGWDAYAFGDGTMIDNRFAFGAPEQMGQGPLGRPIADGNGTIDEGGRLVVHLPVALPRNGAAQQITIEATTTDINQQSVSGRVQVMAYAAGYLIGFAAGQQVVSAGTRTTITAAAVKPNGLPVASVALTASIYRRTYSSGLADNGFGGSLWRQIPHDTPLSTASLVTGSDGLARLSFLPRDGGTYAIVIAGKDAQGKTASATTLVDASAGGFTNFGPSDNTIITLSPDRPRYRVGQTAHVLVAAPFPDATALITVERDSIRSYRVVHLSSNASTIAIPITRADLPNVYLTATVYRGQREGSAADWRYGLAELRVAVAPAVVHIHLSQNRQRYHPGDTVTYGIRTTDARGRPVATELSLALVDTAVLALQPESNADIVRALYGEQPLGVSTASDGAVSINHFQQQPSFEVRLGGGGGGGPSVTVYRHFADTGYWAAAVTTDSAGRASVRVRLPDNFTTWRLDARGVTTNQQVGEARLFTVSTQDIVLRPVVPRFLLQGDSLHVGAVVNNNTARSVRAAISLTASRLLLRSAASVETVVPAHGERLVRWKVAVPVESSAQLSFRVVPESTSVRGYTLQLRVPVNLPLTGETVTAAGEAFDTVRQTIILPAAARRRPGELTVEVSAAITAGMGAAFAQFQAQPYDSNEDIANRLLAAEALRSVPAPLSGLSAITQSRLPAITDGATARLVADQQSDGGWAWFPRQGSPSDPLISADVLWALENEPSSNRTAIARGRAYLRSALTAVAADDRPRLLLVLASAGGADSGQVISAAGGPEARSHLDPAATAYLARALWRTGKRGAALSLVSSLDGQAMVSAAGAHWDGSLMSGQSAIGETAAVLAALGRLTPADPFVPAAARWLMLARQGNGWDCPRNTAMALFALSEYAHRAHEGQAAYRYGVVVDGTPLLSGRYSAKGNARPGRASAPVAQLHRGTPSLLTISRQGDNGGLGSGQLYYVAHLHYFLPAAAVAARNDGISIRRRYLNLAGRALNAVPAGAVVQVELTVSSAQTLTFLDVEDPLPAGLEPIDQSLNTSRQGLFAAWRQPPAGAALAPYLDHIDLRDDRVSLYVPILPAGTYRYTYLAQATIAGRYGSAPARASESFFPEVFGRSAGGSFIVR